MSDLKDLATLHLNTIQKMQVSHKNGNKEALGSLMKSLMNGHEDVYQIANEDSDHSDLPFPKTCLLIFPKTSISRVFPILH